MKQLFILLTICCYTKSFAQNKLIGEHLDSAKLLVNDIQKQFKLNFKQLQSSTGRMQYYYYRDTINGVEIKVSTTTKEKVLPNEVVVSNETIYSFYIYCNLDFAKKCMAHLNTKYQDCKQVVNSTDKSITTKAINIWLTEKSALGKSIIQFTKNY